jgi:hypothetical protein
MPESTQTTSEAIFELLRKEPERFGEELPQLRFARVTATEWKRRKDGEVVCEERPHLIGLDPEAKAFIACSPFMGFGFPVGYLKHNGEWIEGWRFKILPLSTAATMIADLSRELGPLEMDG